MSLGMWEQEASLIFPDCFPLDVEGGDRISVCVCVRLTAQCVWGLCMQPEPAIICSGDEKVTFSVQVLTL